MSVRDKDPKDLELAFVNVGYGEAMLLKVGTFIMLIDGGSADPEEYAHSATGRIPLIEWLQKEKVDHIDLMLNTHIHEDHTSGMLPAALAYTPAFFVSALPDTFYRSMTELDPKSAPRKTAAKFLQAIDDYQRIAAVLERKGTRIVQATAGMEWNPAPGLKIRVLAPSKEKAARLVQDLLAIQAAKTPGERNQAWDLADAAMNNLSIMLMIEYAGRKLLLPGDANAKGYEDLAGEDLSADLFKVGHHGQIDGISRELFERIHPAMVVCCASSDRRYESAAPGLLSMMYGEGAALFFSDCPPTAGCAPAVPPHHTLVFTISPDGKIRQDYQ